MKTGFVFQLKIMAPVCRRKLTSSGSHGLSIIEERLDLLSRKHGQTFEKRIEPLAENTLSTGTCVSLILPSDFGH
jgi:hypothetical protein